VTWAAVDDTTHRVEQYGPRELWDEIEVVYDRWREAGAPSRDRLGLTVTESGAHRFWVDAPNVAVG